MLRCLDYGRDTDDGDDDDEDGGGMTVIFVCLVARGRGKEEGIENGTCALNICRGMSGT